MVYKISLSLAVIGLTLIRRHYQRSYRREEVVKAVRVVESRVSAAVTAALLLPIFLYIFTDLLDRFDFSLPDYLRYSGFFLSLLSLILFWQCHKSLGANWQPDIAIRKTHQLITTGPYRSIRHPMYLSFILLGVGMTLTASNWLIAFITLTPPLAAYLRRSKQEDIMLEDTFGDEYREYKERTGSLLNWRLKRRQRKMQSSMLDEL